ncbi:hypothetical protein K8R47_00285 [archaeon]|nr:hypothetical protein [archaeon]
MLIKEEFLKKLRAAFDLNIYEVKIWTALLSKGVASAGELSDISNVPRSRSYDVLETLEKKGFVLMKLGKPIKYIAVKPEDILSRVKKSLRSKTDEQIIALDNVKSSSVYNELSLLFSQGIKHIDPSTLSGSMKGRDNIYDKFEIMLKNAKKSVNLVTTKDGLERKKDIIQPLLKRLKNIDFKIIVNCDPKDLKTVSEDLSGVDIKTTDKMNARFCVVDGKEVLFMVADDNKVHENYDVGVWVDTEFFSGALQNMFNTTWKSL